MLEDSPRKINEQQLARALQAGKTEALAQLYDVYAPVLLGLIIKIARNREIAESILHDTFLVIWMQRGTYEPAKMGFLTWLIKTAKETALASIKSDKYQNFPNGAEIGNFAPPEQTERELPENFLHSGSACKLSSIEKAALDLIYLKGYNVAEAAAILEIPGDILKSSLKMAVKQLGAEPAS